MEFTELARRVDKQVEQIQRAYSEISNLTCRLGDTVKEYTLPELKEIMRLLEAAGSGEWRCKSKYYEAIQEKEKELVALGIVSP